jgi:hypothetical protein
MIMTDKYRKNNYLNTILSTTNPTYDSRILLLETAPQVLNRDCIGQVLGWAK